MKKTVSFLFNTVAAAFILSFSASTVAQTPQSESTTPEAFQASESVVSCITTCSKPKKRHIEVDFDFDKTRMSPESEAQFIAFLEAQRDSSLQMSFGNITQISLFGAISFKERSAKDKREFTQRMEAVKRFLALRGYSVDKIKFDNEHAFTDENCENAKSVPGAKPSFDCQALTRRVIVVFTVDPKL